MLENVKGEHAPLLFLLKNKTMKKLFLIIVGAAMFSICGNPFQKKAADHSDKFTGANDDKNSIFIIPLDSKSLICNIENNEIRQLGSFSKTMKSKSIVVNDEFICSIDSIISVFDIKGNLLKKIHSDFKLTSLHSKNKVVYFGGKSSEYSNNQGEIFAILDLEKEDFKLEKIKIPIDIKYGKSIDDILILNNKLILVDNIIFPKYLLEYDISEPKNPKHILTKELENNGTYEHIVKGELNEVWLILLSSTVGMGGSSDYIVIDGKTDGYLEVHRDHGFDKERETDIEKPGDFNDICLIDNKLYILVDSTVYTLDLEGNISLENMKKVFSNLSSIKKIIRTPNNEMVFIGLNNQYEKIK